MSRDRRDRPRRMHQDREQGQDEPARRHRAGQRKSSGLRKIRRAGRHRLAGRPPRRAGLRLVDGSFYLPARNATPRRSSWQQHIPGAVFFDIDEIADTSSPLPHMLPSARVVFRARRESGWATATRSWSTTPRRCWAPRASGGCSAPWATRMSRCSTAACQVDERGPPGHRRSDAAARTALHGADQTIAGALGRRRERRWSTGSASSSSMRGRPTRFAARRRSRGPGSRRAVFQAASTSRRRP